MKDMVNSYGKNAGKVWTALNAYGPLNKEELIRKTRLKDNDFFAAVGWLARENKLSKNGSKYELKETNLADVIGSNAGKVWNALYTQADINVTSITEISKITRRDAYTALGWLAREDKIRTKTSKKNSKEIKYMLK